MYLGVLSFIMGKAIKVAFPILLPLVHEAVQPQPYWINLVINVDSQL